MPASLAVQATRVPRFQAICDKVAAGQSFKAACEATNVAPNVAREWLKSSPERQTMATMLTHARTDQAGSLLDEALDIADADSDRVQQARLRVDARLRMAPLLAPRKYGKLAGMEDVAAVLLVAFTGLALPEQVQAEVTEQEE